MDTPADQRSSDASPRRRKPAAAQMVRVLRPRGRRVVRGRRIRFIASRLSAKRLMPARRQDHSPRPSASGLPVNADCESARGATEPRHRHGPCWSGRLSVSQRCFSRVACSWVDWSRLCCLLVWAHPSAGWSVRRGSAISVTARADLGHHGAVLVRLRSLRGHPDADLARTGPHSPHRRAQPQRRRRQPSYLRRGGLSRPSLAPSAAEHAPARAAAQRNTAPARARR